jgi:hypothetical protein
MLFGEAALFLLDSQNSQVEAAKASGTPLAQSASVVTLTPAEIAFRKRQDELVRCHLTTTAGPHVAQEMKKILENAALSHKQKVLEYNQKLDKLSEHHDIPKVSWTK